MSWLDDEGEDPDLTPAERAWADALRPADVERIDATLLAEADSRFRKVARVVGCALMKLLDDLPGLSPAYCSQRVQSLVARGLLVSQGNLRRMRFSEVRFPDPSDADEVDSEEALA